MSRRDMILGAVTALGWDEASGWTAEEVADLVIRELGRAEPEDCAMHLASVLGITANNAYLTFDTDRWLEEFGRICQIYSPE